MYEIVANDFPYDIYFIMSTRDGKVAFLYVTPEECTWVVEKDDLKKGKCQAFVFDLNNGDHAYSPITFSNVGGGPVFEVIENK